MADPILHAQFVPFGGRGGQCTTGEVILGPNNATATEYHNRFAVFSPASRLSTVWEITAPVGWRLTGAGCPWNGGVAMPIAAGAGSGATYVLVAYPDGTYDLLDPGQSWGAGAVCATLGGKLLLIRSAGPSPSRIFDPGTATWSNGSSSVLIYHTPSVSGGLLWGWSNGGNIHGINAAGALITTISTTGIGTPTGQQIVVAGRLWTGHGSGLRSVRLSDGDVFSITTPGWTGIAYDGTHFWTSSTSAAYRVNPLTLDIVTYPFGSTLQPFEVYLGAGRAFVACTLPSS